jgi:hypothetical protein
MPREDLGEKIDRQQSTDDRFGGDGRVLLVRMRVGHDICACRLRLGNFADQG